MNTRTTVGSGGPVAGADGSVKVKTGRTRQWNPLPEGTETSLEKTMAMSVQLSSVQFKMVSMRSEKPIIMRSTPSIRRLDREC